MLHAPCNSFSAARRAPIGSRMPRRLRSDLHPEGILVPGLTAKDVETAEIGNIYLRACLRIIAECDRVGIPWAVENPRSILFGKMSGMRKLASASHVRLCNLDHCQYKCAWRKPTTIMCGNCQAAPFLQKLCCLKKGYICSATGQRHYVLDGPGRTKQAQTYSHSLAAALTRLFRGAWTVSHFSVMDSALRR